VCCKELQEFHRSIVVKKPRSGLNLKCPCPTTISQFPIMWCRPSCFSAGAGRTGTFIALSNILERVKAEGLLDVFQTVKSLRMQRPHMVQTVVGGQRDNVIIHK